MHIILNSFFYNISYSVFLVKFFKKVNKQYQEYLIFHKTYKEDEENLVKAGVKVGIQQKLLISFVGLIFIPIVGLSGILMVDFSNTLLVLL